MPEPINPAHYQSSGLQAMKLTEDIHMLVWGGIVRSFTLLRCFIRASTSVSSSFSFLSCCVSVHQLSLSAESPRADATSDFSSGSAALLWCSICSISLSRTAMLSLRVKNGSRNTQAKLREWRSALNPFRVTGGSRIIHQGLRNYRVCQRLTRDDCKSLIVSVFLC